LRGPHQKDSDIKIIRQRHHWHAQSGQKQLAMFDAEADLAIR
jgi:hypothetical protein